jgi:hypothetical protein
MTMPAIEMPTTPVASQRAIVAPGRPDHPKYRHARLCINMGTRTGHQGGELTSAFRALGAEGLVSSGMPTVF